MGNSRLKPRKGHSANGEEYYGKKLHACKVNLKRAIKKSKEAEVRKVVRNLKKAKDSDPTNVTDLENKLHRTKAIDIAKIWNAFCEDSQEGLDEDSMGIANSQVVIDHVQTLKDITEKLNEAKKKPTTNTEPLQLEVETQGNDEKKKAAAVEQAPVKEAAQKDQVKKKKPKNRMGQRARQRLAEKMHGANAKHKTTEKKKKKPMVATEPDLHPSWAAKKESKNMVAINVHKPAGKKIVFD